MVVFSATQISDKLADFAIETAFNEKARLIVLDVRGMNMSGRVTQMMGNVGFLGKKILHELQDDIKETRGEFIIKALENIKRKAKQRGVETEFIVTKGPHIENILRVAKEKRVSAIIAQKRITETVKEAPFEVIYIKDEIRE